MLEKFWRLLRGGGSGQAVSGPSLGGSATSGSALSGSSAGGSVGGSAVGGSGLAGSVVSDPKTAFDSAGNPQSSVSQKTLAMAEGRPQWWQKSLEPDYPGIPVNPSLDHLNSVSQELRKKLSARVARVSVKMPTSFELFRALNDPNVTTRRITEIAGRDPVFAASVIRTVNSAWFGLRDQVSSLGRAIVLLGYNNVKALALQQSFSGTTNVNAGHQKELWIHSAVTASVATALARNIRGQDPGEVSTIALLHDLGGILMDGSDLEAFAAKVHVPAKVVESLLGGLLARYWELPETICKAVEEYTWPVYFYTDEIWDTMETNSRIVCLSDYFTNYFGFHDLTSKYAPPAEFLQNSGFSESPQQWLKKEHLAEIEKTRLIMESIF